MGHRLVRHRHSVRRYRKSGKSLSDRCIIEMTGINGTKTERASQRDRKIPSYIIREFGESHAPVWNSGTGHMGRNSADRYRQMCICNHLRQDIALDQRRWAYLASGLHRRQHSVDGLVHAKTRAYCSRR